MTKRKDELTLDLFRCGYLKVGRPTLRALFSEKPELRGLATVLLCVQTFAYFSDGVICLNNQSVLCKAGEWITSFTEIATLTELDRRSVKMNLQNLEERGFLHTHDLGKYKRISLAIWEPEAVKNTNTPPSADARAYQQLEAGVGIFDQAGQFYQSCNGKKKWIN